MMNLKLQNAVQRACTLFFFCLFVFFGGVGGGMFREGVKFSKSLEMADSFFKCNRFFLGGGDKILECCFNP